MRRKTSYRKEPIIMARKPKYTTETLIELIDQYFAEKCDYNVSLLKIPLIGKYIREKGFDVADYLLRRNTEVADHIKQLHLADDETHIHIVSVYRDMDIDAFLSKNHSINDLKAALREREQYYREVSRSAAHIFKENKKLKKQNRKLSNENEELTTELKKLQDSDSANTTQLKSIQKELQSLRSIIDTYVHPEIANELLKKEGLLQNTSGVIVPEMLEQDIVDANTDIQNIQNNIIKGLFESL